jgi:hypothetical protein
VLAPRALLFALNFFADKIPCRQINDVLQPSSHPGRRLLAFGAAAGSPRGAPYRRPAGGTSRPARTSPRPARGADQHLARAVQQHRRLVAEDGV